MYTLVLEQPINWYDCIQQSVGTVHTIIIMYSAFQCVLPPIVKWTTDGFRAN